MKKPRLKYLRTTLSTAVDNSKRCAKFIGYHEPKTETSTKCYANSLCLPRLTSQHFSVNEQSRKFFEHRSANTTKIIVRDSEGIFIVLFRFVCKKKVEEIFFFVFFSYLDSLRP
jgi:hypothetical protein